MATGQVVDSHWLYVLVSNNNVYLFFACKINHVSINYTEFYFFSLISLVVIVVLQLQKKAH